MILASISGGQSLGKPFPDLSRQGQSLCEGPFSVSCRKSKPFKPSDAVGFGEKSHLSGGPQGSPQSFSVRRMIRNAYPGWKAGRTSWGAFKQTT